MKKYEVVLEATVRISNSFEIEAKNDDEANEKANTAMAEERRELENRKLGVWDLYDVEDVEVLTLTPIKAKRKP